MGVKTVFIAWNGETKTISDWADHFGISYACFQGRRHKGVPMEDMGKPRVYSGGGRPKGAKDKQKRKPGTGLWQKKAGVE